MTQKDEINLVVDGGKVYIEFESFIKLLRNDVNINSENKEMIEVLNDLADVLEQELKVVIQTLQLADGEFNGPTN